MDRTGPASASNLRSLTEQELVALLLQQDRRAIEAIYHRYGEILLGILFRMVGKEEIAEDILQECLVKFWKSATQYDATRGRLFTWLVNICRHTAIDKMRTKGFQARREIQKLDDLVGNKAEDIQSFNPDAIGVREWVSKLKPEQVEIIDVVYFLGMTHTEAAKHLNLPLGTLKTRLRSAIQQLRSWLKNEEARI